MNNTKLVIVESPAKAKTIGKMLGPEFVIKASMGHVRDLPERAFGVDIEHNFQPQYEENKGRGKNLSDLKQAAKEACEIYLAPDPDREGEAIAWHLHEVLAKVNKKAPFLRVSFHEITKSAIAKAFECPGEVNMNLVDAQQARRVLDRIVGYQISPLLWSRIERGVSAGRVQSVALRLVCEREREILAFVPTEYWNFSALFESDVNAGSGRNFLARLAKINHEKFEIGNRNDATRVLDAVRSTANWTVSSIEKQPRRKFAAPPFITSTLQQAASSALGSSANQTMRVAQQLYEGVDVGNGPIGLITYMRTDSVAVAVEAQNNCRSFISTVYGPDYVPAKANIYKSKSNAQGAHEAIRPTDVRLTPEKVKSFLEPQQWKLYTLIWRRFVASQMAPAQQERTTVTLDGKAKDKNTYTFRSTATVTKFPGFLRAYDIAEEGIKGEEDDDTKDAAILAELREQQPCVLGEALSEQKFTEPAPRFSEATLIKELESNGIGRPSTYATIVNTIQVRQYVNKDKGKLIPTELGFKINDYLVESLPELFQVGFTASMEDQLDRVEEGSIQWTGMMAAFYERFSQWLSSAKNAGAPEVAKAKDLIETIAKIQNWDAPEAGSGTGKRVYDDKKFFVSVQKKFEKASNISAKQWEALLALALKYEAQIPTLRSLASADSFLEDLAEAEEKRKELEIAREERRIRREEAEAAAPPQEGIPEVFKAMEGLSWAQPEKRRGRVYDDKKFFESLKKQSESGKSLSEKQIAALGKIMEKYRTQLPEYNQLAPLLGLGRNASGGTQADGNSESASGTEAVSNPEKSERQIRIETILKRFESVEKWADPVSKGRRKFDDHEFISSIANQAQSGKILSDRQVAALEKLALKYNIQVQ